MPNALKKQIFALTPDQALESAEALVTLLEGELSENIDTQDFDQLVSENDAQVGSLYRALRDENLTDEEAAQGAKSLLLLVAGLGFEDRVRLAIEAGSVHQRDFGALSGPLIIAALAVVIAYIPKEQYSKVKEVEYISADGSMKKEKTSEKKTTRVGAEVVGKLADWWAALLT